MGHLTSRDAYRNLEDRINWFTQGAPPSKTLTKILQVLFTEKEAKWVAMLPIRPFSLKKAAKIWGTSEAKAEKLLDRLCEKGLLVDSYYQGTRQFVLPPPMIGFFEFALMQPIETTNYIPKINDKDCVSCGKCSKVCPILAISMKDKKPVVDESICLGCGICARNCPKKAITLQRRPIQVITPVNSTHRVVLQAIEKGTLQNLVFDNQAFANHRAMAAVFGTILKLPPMQQALASKQFKSVYLDKLLSRGK